MNQIVPVILAGGKGSRLWPLSRKSFPKQFLNLLNEDNNTLLQKTYLRTENLKNLSRPIIICNEEHRFIVGDQMRNINIKPLSILLEPVGRNTAPAIAMAALKSIEHYADPTLLILSSDHDIKDVNKFTSSIEKSLNLAEDGNLIIFGVEPTFPSTGYGYIKSFDEIDHNNYFACKVEKFLEKPEINVAKEIFEDKKYAWNSGMFVFKARVIIDELKKFAPDIVENCERCLLKSKKDLDFFRLNKNHFLKCKDISIDYAVLEKTKNAFVLPLNCGWNDIGSWESLWEIAKKDSDGNAIKGNVLAKKTTESIIRSEEKLIVSIGLKNIIIIETRDALLVANKKDSQKIKSIVDLLNEKGLIEGEQHKKVFRPWGNYLSIEESEKWQIKKIEVNSGASLSLQMHKHRAEHWVVVKGRAKVEVDNKEQFLSVNESTFIPLGSKHRLSNPGNDPLILIEVQTGDYLGEDDIIRFEDKYGRD